MTFSEWWDIQLRDPGFALIPSAMKERLRVFAEKTWEQGRRSVTRGEVIATFQNIWDESVKAEPSLAEEKQVAHFWLIKTFALSEYDGSIVEPLPK